MNYKKKMKKGLEDCLHKKIDIHSFSIHDANNINSYTTIYTKINHIGRCEIAWISENIPNTLSIRHIKNNLAIKLIMKYAAIKPRLRSKE